ncbi:MAG: hypothetical protein AAGF97_06150, partial [Planctomycetota bacterium]
MRSISFFRLFFLSFGISCSVAAAVSHAGEINGSLQDAPPLQVSSLRKFELKTVGLDLEGYFMDLHGVSDPQLRGSQIDAVYPETPMTNFPPGWIPPSLTPLSPTGTRVSWGGAFQGTIANRPIGFGVGLSPQGEANLEQLCARWLRGDQPVTYPYFDPTLPLVQLGQPTPAGTTSLTIGNPVCPPFEAEDRWVGSVYGQVIDGQLGFEQLTIENPLF